MGFFEWWTDLHFDLRTNPKRAFYIGAIVGLVIGLIVVSIGVFASSESSGLSTGEEVGIVIGVSLGIALLMGGILALNARFFTARVDTYKRKAGLDDSEALKQSLADSRQQEILGSMSGLWAASR